MDIKIPKKIKVGGLVYKVEIVDELERGCADTHYGKQRIRIEKADPKFMQQVFVHELLHTINGEWVDEQIEFMAMSWFQIFQDNPNLFVKRVRGGD